MSDCVECLRRDVERLLKAIDHMPNFCMCNLSGICTSCPNEETPEDEFPCNECGEQSAWKHWNPRDITQYWNQP
jgi:hypothetical protein